MVFTAILLEGVDLQIIGLAAPSILREWSLTKASLGIAMAASLLGTALGAFSGGRLGDVYGRRPVLIGSVGLFGLWTLLVAFSDSIGQLALLRLLAGLGFGAALSTATALIAEWMPPRQRERLVSLLILGVPIGGMIGAAAATRIIPLLGWRAAFVMGGVLPVLLVLAMLARLPESPQFQLLEVPATTGGAFRWRMLFDAARARTTVGLGIAFSANLAVSYAFFNWAPTFLASLRVAPGAALSSLFYFNLCGAVGIVLSAFAVTHYGSKVCLGVLVALGVLASGLMMGIVANTALPIPAQEQSLLIAFMAIAGVGTIASQSALYALAAESYPTICRATGIGLAGTVGRVGAMVSGVGGGAVLDRASGPALFVGAVGILFVFCGIGVALIKSRDARSAT